MIIKAGNMQKNSREYFDLIAGSLSNKFLLSPKLKKLVGQHPPLIGAFAESVVREFVENTVRPLRVSTGAIISPKAFRQNEKLEQIDTIIWKPNPLPAVCEAGHFALVPRQSSFAVLEIKNSDYAGIASKIKYITDNETKLTIGPAQRMVKAALGVIVLQKKPKLNIRLQQQVDCGKAVVLLKQEGEDLIPNTEGIIELINFLSFDLQMRVRSLSSYILESAVKE